MFSFFSFLFLFGGCHAARIDILSFAAITPPLADTLAQLPLSFASFHS